VGVTEHWNRLPGEVVELPPLERLKPHLDACLCDLLQGTCFSSELNLVILRGPFQPLQFCDCVIATLLKSAASVNSLVKKKFFALISNARCHDCISSNAHFVQFC